jgi:glucose/arabinose dehydrogenase
MSPSPAALITATLLGLAMNTMAHAQQTPTPQPMPQQQPQPQPQPQPMPDAPTTTTAPSGLPSFDELDKAHHGYLNRRDIPSDVDALKPLRAHFMEADSDGNGRLDPKEYAAYAAAHAPGAHPGGVTH